MSRSRQISKGGIIGTEEDSLSEVEASGLGCSDVQGRVDEELKRALSLE